MFQTSGDSTAYHFKPSIARRNDIRSRRRLFDGDTSMVQLPSECFWSGAGDGFVAVLAISGGTP